MSLVIPALFDDELLPRLQAAGVAWLYGALPADPSFRAKKWLPQVDRDRFAEHVAAARRLDIGFVYTLNTRAPGSWEYTAEGQKWLVDRLGWLVEIGVDGLVTANPYVVEFTAQRFPELRVHVSTLADVDGVDKALFFERLGAHSIYLPEYVNRDFRFLGQVVGQSRCALVLTANLGCVARCPIRNYHVTTISESGSSLDNGHFVDYSMMKCSSMKAESAGELIKGPWIRPEDLPLYEGLGIHRFKLAGRENGADWVLRAMQAYAERRYDGHLNDLLNGLDFEPFGRLPLLIDNRALDGFLSFFVKNGCTAGCFKCNYCDRWAAQAVEADEEERRQYQGRLGRLLARFTSGSFRAPLAPPRSCVACRD